MTFPGYKTQAWRKVRAAQLQRVPRCEWCGGQGAYMAVDHILPVKTHPHMWDVTSNLRTLCSSCHNKRSSRDGQRGHGAKPAVECGVDGMPTDPDHPWNRR